MNGKRFLREDYEVVRYMLGNEDEIKGLEWLTNNRTGKMHQDQFRMWLDGASYSKIAEQYCSTPGTMHNHLVKTGRILMSRHLERQEKPDVTSMDKFYSFIEKVAEDNDMKNLVVRAANCFIRSLSCSPKDWKNIDFLKVLKEMSVDEIRNLIGVGSRSAKLLFIAHKSLWNVCDRCGKELPTDHTLVTFGNHYKRLCAECSDKLAMWFEKEGDQSVSP